MNFHAGRARRSDCGQLQQNRVARRRRGRARCLWRHSCRENESFRHFDSARIVIVDAYAHTYGIGGQNRSHTFGPLYEAQGAAVEVILYTNLKSFVEVFDTIKIEVVNQLGSGFGAVFVNQSEGRRSSVVAVNAERTAKLVYECGFPAPISP